MKVLRKVLSFVIAFAMIACTVPMSSFAGSTPAVSVAKVSGDQGSSVNVAVTLENAQSLGSCGIKLSYDADALTAKEITNGTIDNMEKIAENIEQAGSIIVGGISSTSADISGTYFTISFDIAATAQAKEYAIEITAADLNDENALPLATVEKTNGSVTVTEPNTATIKISDTNAKQGETVDVPVTLAGMKNAQGFGLELAYDSAALTLSSVEKGTAAQLSVYEINTKTPGKILINAMSNAEIDLNGVFVTLKFVVADAAALGKSDITVSYVEIPFAPTPAITNGSVTISAKPILAEPKLTAASVSGQQGSTVNVTITAADLTAVQGVGFELNFDGDALTPSKIEKGTAANLGYVETNITKKGKVIFNGINANNVSVDGTFATITFAIADSAAVKDYDLTFANIETPNVTGTTGTNGKITVTAKPIVKAPKLTASTVSGQQGSTVDVVITAADLDAVQGVGFELGFDGDALTPTKITNGTATGLTSIETNITQKGKIIFNGMNGSDVNVNGTFATITFAIADDAAVKDYDLTFANIETPNVTGTTGTNGKITVTAKPIVKAPNLTASTVGGQQGSTVNVVITAADLDAVQGVGFVLNFDGDALTPSKVVAGTGANLSTIETNLTQKGKVIFNGMSAADVNVNGTFATITFAIADDAAVKDYNLSFTDIETPNVTGTTGTNGKITVTAKPIVKAPKLTASTVSGQQGSTVDVVITAADLDAVQGVGFVLNFDGAALTPVSIANGTAASLATVETNITKTGKVIFNGMNATDVNVNGTFATITFAIADDAAVKDYNLSLTDIETPNVTGTTAANGKITVTAKPIVKTPKLTASTVSGQQGSTVDVVITAADLDAVQGVGFELNFDGDALSPTKLVKGTAASLATAEPNLTQKGKVIFNGMNGSAVNVNGTFATITFAIADNATAKDYDLTFANIETPNVTGTTAANGKITVTAKPIVKTPKLTASTVSGQQGSTVDVVITAADLDAVQGVGFELNFDGDALSPTKLVNGTAASLATVEPNLTQKGKVIFNGMNGSAVNVNGTFATITFAIADNATVKDYDLTFANIETPNVTGTTAANGKITVTAKPVAALVSIAANKASITVPYANKDAVDAYIKENITVTATYDDNTKLPISNYAVVADNGTATISYQGKDTTLTYEIGDPLMTGLEATPASVVVPYANKDAAADYIKTQITVKAVYENGTKPVVTDYTINAANGTATVSYNSKTATVSYSIAAALLTGLEATPESVVVPYANKDATADYIKTQITVKAVYENGTKPVVTDYTINAANGTATVSYNSKTATVSYTVAAALMTGIEADKASVTIPYANKDAIESYIRSQITVKAIYEDGSKPVLTSYTIQLDNGTATISNNGKQTTIAYTMENAVLTGLEATPASVVVPYANKDAAADYIKTQITVKAVYEDGTKPVVTDYTINAANGTATVSYNSKTATVSYTVAAALMTGIEADKASVTIPYANKDAIESYIRSQITVKAIYEDGSKPVLTSYTIQLDNGTATISNNGKQTTVAYTLENAVLTGLEATPESVVVPYANKDAAADYIKTQITVKAVYEDGTKPVVTDYTINAANGTATVSYNSKTATVSYSIADPLVTGITADKASVTVPYANKDAIADYIKTQIAVTATYEDGTTPIVTEYTINAADGTATITFEGKQTTVAYTVESAPQTGLELDKTTLQIPYGTADWEKYIQDNVVVKAVYEGGEKKVVADYDMTLGTDKATFTRGGFEAELPLTFETQEKFITVTPESLIVSYANHFGKTDDEIAAYVNTKIKKVVYTDEYGRETILAPEDYTCDYTNSNATITYGTLTDGIQILLGSKTSGKAPSASGSASKITYTLTFETNGGTAVSKLTKEENTSVNINQKTTKEGYTFGGWYSDDELTEPVTSVKMTRDFTVYAKWTKDDEPDVPGDDEPDVPGDDEEITKGEHDAYMQGYPDGTIHPESNITRAEVSAIFYGLLGEEAIASAQSSFSDVKDGDWFNEAVTAMAEKKIVTGYEDGTFLPNATITRAEFATIIARYNAVANYEGADHFTDISEHWANAYINSVAEKGWVTGRASGIFAPDASITRAEVMTIVNRMLDRDNIAAENMTDDMKKWSDNTADKWYYEAVQEATNSHSFTKDKDGVEKWVAVN